MPSTYTDSLGLELQANGENLSTWGTKANAVFSLLEEAVSGYAAVTIAGDTTLTITDGTASSGATDQARNGFIKLTGTPGAGFALTLPEVAKAWLLWNDTDGAATVKTTTATATVTLPVDQLVVVQSDGAGSVLQVTPFFTDTGEIPVGQIENMGATTVSATQWGYVGGADQAVKTTDSVTFAGVTATTADINGGSIDGATVGGTTAAPGTFTTLTASTSATVAGLAYPTTDGAAGQYVTTDGAGNLTFGTPAGAGDMLAAANLSDVADAATARANLGVISVGDNFQEFTASGTWTKPEIATWLYVELIGGGGGGANQTGSDNSGGGGGGEGFGKLYRASEFGATETVTIGAGGAGAANGVIGHGSTGGDSSFGTLTAKGGQEGFATPSGQGGAGGGYIAGGVVFSGRLATGQGAYQCGGGGSHGGGGGSCVLGGAGGGGAGASTTQAGVSTLGGDGGASSIASGVAGSSGSAPGGGGGGSSNDGGGGDGGNGRVRVWAW